MEAQRGLVMVVTQRDAARILQHYLFEGPDRSGVFWFRRWAQGQSQFEMPGGQLVREHEASGQEINERRDLLVGKTFRFTWQEFPRGAYCPMTQAAPHQTNSQGEQT